MVTVFFSYSHRDEDLRNELETHLSMLKRQGVIRTWHDRRIGPGKDVDTAISKYLETSEVILLLISPYFLASDYCYNVEMTRALERHNAGEARVIPVILHPCDWHQAPFGGLRATPTDGKPVSKFANMHDAFLEIVNDIRQAAADFGRETETIAMETKKSPELPQPPTSAARSSNLRVRREFSDHDRDRFLDESYTYIERFFETSLGELQRRSPGIETRFRKVDQSHFTAAVYVTGSKRSSCRIWLAGRGSFPGGIGYSANEDSSDSSFNEALSITDDGYSLLLKPMGLAFHGGSRDDNLTQHGGAEYFWSIFIQPVQ